MTMKVISKKYWLLDQLIFIAEVWAVGWGISVSAPLVKSFWGILFYLVGITMAMLVFFGIVNLAVHMRLYGKIYGPRLPDDVLLCDPKEIE